MCSGKVIFLHILSVNWLTFIHENVMKQAENYVAINFKISSNVNKDQVQLPDLQKKNVPFSLHFRMLLISWCLMWYRHYQNYKVVFFSLLQHGNLARSKLTWLFSTLWEYHNNIVCLSTGYMPGALLLTRFSFLCLTCLWMLNIPPASSIVSLMLAMALFRVASPSVLSSVEVVITYRGGAIRFI